MRAAGLASSDSGTSARLSYERLNDAGGEPQPSVYRYAFPPDRHLLTSGEGTIQSWNSQAVVDGGHQIFWADGFSNQAMDAMHWHPLCESIAANSAPYPNARTVDAGEALRIT